jgi:hypothetical protein
MYVLSTIIFVIRKVFYEAKNGQTQGSQGQTAIHRNAGARFSRGIQGHKQRSLKDDGHRIRLGEKSLAFRRWVWQRLNSYWSQSELNRPLVDVWPTVRQTCWPRCMPVGGSGVLSRDSPLPPVLFSGRLVSASPAPAFSSHFTSLYTKKDKPLAGFVLYLCFRNTSSHVHSFVSMIDRKILSFRYGEEYDLIRHKFSVAVRV